MIFDNGERAQDSRYRLKVVKAIGGRTLVRRGTFVASESRSRTSRKDPTMYAILRIWLRMKTTKSSEKAEYVRCVAWNHVACLLSSVFSRRLVVLHSKHGFGGTPLSFFCAEWLSLGVTDAEEKRKEKMGKSFYRNCVLMGAAVLIPFVLQGGNDFAKYSTCMVDGVKYSYRVINGEARIGYSKGTSGSFGPAIARETK